MLPIDASRALLNSASLCCAVRPSVSAREKLAITPWLRASRCSPRREIASRERHHAQHLRMLDEIRVEIIDGWDRELQHHLLLPPSVSSCFRMAALRRRSAPSLSVA
jgi:hypothetical protein